MNLIKKFKKGDLAIALVIVTLSFSPFAILKKQAIGAESNIIVAQDDKVIGRYDLNYSKKVEHIDFQFESKGKTHTGTLETMDGKVRLLRLPEEAVPKAIHADMSWIEAQDEIIVALPAKLVVYIENVEKKPSQVDVIAD